MNKTNSNNIETNTHNEEVSIALNSTKKLNRAIALVSAKFTNPVVLKQMGRKEFDGFLHEAFGAPADDAWKSPVVAEELKDDEDFYLVEYFDTPIGPLMAAHINEYAQPVLVVINKRADQ